MQLETTTQDSAAAAVKLKEFRPNSWSNVKRRKLLLLMIVPGLIFFLIFHYIPMYGLLIGFEDFKMKAGHSYLENIANSQWVGWDNFTQFFKSPQFNNVMTNTVVLSLLQLLFGFPIPIIFALLLNEVRNAKYKKFVQTVSYLPHFLSVVAIVGMLKLVLSPSGGIVNTLLENLFGIDSIYFFGDPDWFRPLYVGSGVWQEFGFGAIIYLAALSKVETHLYESAVIDGASKIRQMWHITLPALKPTIIILLILNMSNLMGVGADKVLLMYSPSTYDTADIISTYVYRRGLAEMNYSFGTAVGLFNSLINVAFLVTANYLSRRFTEESLY